MVHCQEKPCEEPNGALATLQYPVILKKYKFYFTIPNEKLKNFEHCKNHLTCSRKRILAGNSLLNIKEHILAKYSDDKMGARPLKRALQNVVEDKLAEEILSGRVKAGDTVTAGFRKGQVVFQTAEEKRTG